MNRELRVLSCVPPQHYTLEAKLQWIDRTAGLNQPDIFATPQEFFGGDVIMPNHPTFEESELLGDLVALCESHDMALVTGVVEREDERNYERLWFIDPREGGLLGKITKFALPSYSLAKAGGTYQTYPETDFRNRSVIFNMRGAKIAGMFCWEVFSDFLWFALGRREPDVVFSLIKFGPMAYPKLTGNKEDGKRIESFGIASGENHWVRRLELASKYEVACPIICATNTWGLPAKSEPICGQVEDLLGRSTLWKPPVWGGTDRCNSHVQVDTIDVAKVRASRLNAWKYRDIMGEFPPFARKEHTMWLKIRRIERTLDGVEELEYETIEENENE